MRRLSSRPWPVEARICEIVCLQRSTCSRNSSRSSCNSALLAMVQFEFADDDGHRPERRPQLVRRTGGERAERENLLVAQTASRAAASSRSRSLRAAAMRVRKKGDDADADHEVEPHAEDVQGKAAAVGGVFARVAGGAGEQGVELRQIALRWWQRQLPEDQEGVGEQGDCRHCPGVPGGQHGRGQCGRQQEQRDEGVGRATGKVEQQPENADVESSGGRRFHFRTTGPPRRAAIG
jgi:hypothetical protein